MTKQEDKSPIWEPPNFKVLPLYLVVHYEGNKTPIGSLSDAAKYFQSPADLVVVVEGGKYRQLTPEEQAQVDWSGWQIVNNTSEKPN